tara:strand:+ start:134 stop:286 length:153 start_codon:yes stop_codon:yes gene_type:complete
LVTTSEDIDGVLTEHIGPMIAMHGGSIELLDYDEEPGDVMYILESVVARI